MKIAVVGGTGKLGVGLAAQLMKKYEVYIGSRDQAKAERAAQSVPGLKGGEQVAVAAMCDAAILSIPYEAIGSVAALEEGLAGKLVISPVVPLRVDGGTFVYALEDGSAAQTVASMLKRSRVAAALHTVPARFVLNPGNREFDVLVAADDKGTYQEAAEVVGTLSGAKPMYAGPLSGAASVERLTPLLLNLAKLNGVRTPSVRIVL